MNSYHNTTNQDDDFVLVEEFKARTQEDIILNIFNVFPRMTASEIHQMFDDINIPLTSIRRGMSNLKKRGVLIKTEDTKVGIYGKPEYIYKLV